MSHPAPGAARRTRVLIRGHTGSRRRSDHTSVTVGDASFLLDRSGCRELPSGSVPEGKWRRPQYYKTNVGAYNIVWTLHARKVSKRLSGHILMVLSYRRVGYGPWYCG